MARSKSGKKKTKQKSEGVLSRIGRIAGDLIRPADREDKFDQKLFTITYGLSQLLLLRPQSKRLGEASFIDMLSTGVEVASAALAKNKSLASADGKSIYDQILYLSSRRFYVVGNLVPCAFSVFWRSLA